MPTVVPIDDVLVDFVGRPIAIGRHGDIELIQIVDRDVEDLGLR